MAKSVLSTFFSHGSFKIKVHVSSSQNNTQLLLKKDVCMHALLENYKVEELQGVRLSTFFKNRSKKNFGERPMSSLEIKKKLVQKRKQN